MSTRVQKGGPVFRPVAKPRPRHGGESSKHPLSNASTPAPDALSQTTTSAPSSSMPPPSTTRVKPPQAPSASQPNPQTESRPESSTTLLGPPNVVAITPGRDRLSANQITVTRPVDSLQPPSIAASNNGRAPPAIVSNPQHNQTSSLRPISSTIASSPTPISLPSRETRQSMPPPDEIRSEPPEPPHPLHDAQIDPALLEAVVAALQHVEPQDSTSSHSQTTTDIPQNQVSSSTQLATQTSNEGEPRTTRPRRKRANRKTNEGDAGEEGEEDDDDTPLSSKSTNKKPTPRKKRVPRKRARSTQSEQTDADAEGEDEDEGNESSSSRTKKRSRKNSTTSSTNGNGTRKRKAKAPSPLPYDAEADPGEEIDPTAVTMASLCDDTGRGRVSSKAAQILNNHAAWKASNKEKRARMRAIMEAKKYGRDLEAEEEREEGSGVGTSAMKENQAEGSSGNGEEQNGGPSMLGLDEEEPRKDDEFDYSQTVATSGFNVQVRIGPNGETIIDEHSLFVDRNGEDDTAHYTHVEESDATKFVNSGSYSKKLRGSRWSAEETELFFDALSQFGENYELISYVLPGRDRKACKNKFKAEDKKNPGRITQCLKERRPYDIQTLSRMTGKDFSGPTPEIRTPTPVVHPPLEEQHTAQTAAAPSTAHPKKRKKQAKQDDGVEILGDISDIEKEDFEFPSNIS